MKLDTVYSILTDTAKMEIQITYGELSQKYFDREQEWHDPHGSWDEPLGELNRLLHDAGLPPLSSVVVMQETKEPGGGFWESSPNVPRRPAQEIARIAAYSRLLKTVYAATWPDTVPGLA